MSVPEEKGPPVAIPPLKADIYRRTTVLPYLDAYHYETERELEEVYFTEHDLNRKLMTISFLMKQLIISIIMNGLNFGYFRGTGQKGSGCCCGNKGSTTETTAATCCS